MECLKLRVRRGRKGRENSSKFKDKGFCHTELVEVSRRGAKTQSHSRHCLTYPPLEGEGGGLTSKIASLFSSLKTSEHGLHFCKSVNHQPVDYQ